MNLHNGADEVVFHAEQMQISITAKDLVHL